MPSYVLLGELALGEVLAGTLPRPSYPAALRVTAPRRWQWEATFALQHADAHRRRGDVTACIWLAALVEHLTCRKPPSSKGFEGTEHEQIAG
jgi:hypothetical protein